MRCNDSNLNDKRVGTKRVFLNRMLNNEWFDHHETAAPHALSLTHSS